MSREEDYLAALKESVKRLEVLAKEAVDAVDVAKIKDKIKKMKEEIKRLAKEVK